jgi:hypothetical protein
MPHLTPEQLEEWLDAPASTPDHARDCPSCRQRYEDALALRRRLRTAFVGVHVDEALAHQVATAVRAASGRASRPAPRPLWRWLPASLAAAAVLIAMAAVGLYLAGPRPAEAAPAELVQIHQANLMPHADLHGSDDANRIAEYLRKQLGFLPAMPRLGEGMALRGCCVAYFRNRPVGSYVMDTGRGVVSIIVVRERAASLSLDGRVAAGGQTYCVGAFARNRLVAVDRGGFTYCAVGETDSEWLIQLLRQLLPQD